MFININTLQGLCLTEMKNPWLQKNVNDKFDIDITKYQNEEEQEQDISMSS